ncbi:MAG: methionine biosynthesis protein MetW [Planctomycetaceae bacterium]|jgi:methionine biosynthesis protein MetW|nr:methionine biosynthesis protein MetW [Planctomycetaceae bacterium]MDP7276972.1 methionine biosynthesis protein MetW [Planctomycetaceae bacterium]
MNASRYSMPGFDSGLIDELLLDQVDSGSRVIDLGCGDGRLLARLRDERNCQVLGIELGLVELTGAIGRGLSVIQTDLDRGLDDIPDDSFDTAVLSQTLQEVRRPTTVLREMLRVAQRALIVVPNFGHWRVRLKVVQQGRAPVTDALPYEWYDTPNLHVCSMHDIRDLVEQLGFFVIREIPIIKGRPVERAWWANLRADSALYVVERTGE